MGVFLLLSQERWQKFVSFGFDRIISGFCYLIRQKFKLTSFSIACFWVSWTVWSGFGNCSGEERKGNLCLGTVVRKEGKPFTWAPGAPSAFQKRSATKSSHLTLVGATFQGQVEGRLGQIQPPVVKGAKRKVGRWVCSHFWFQVPLVLYNVVKHSVRLSPRLQVLLTGPGSPWRSMPIGCAFLYFFPSIPSPQG